MTGETWLDEDFSEVSPLLFWTKLDRKVSEDEEALLAQYFENRVIDNIPFPTKKWRNTLRWSLITICIVLAVFGRVGFVPYSLQSPEVMGLGTNTVGAYIIGWLCVYGYTTSFSFIMAWAFLKIIETFLKQYSPEQIIINTKIPGGNKWDWRKTVPLALGLVIGSLCVIPIAFLGYEAWLPTAGQHASIWIGVGMFFASFSLPTYSSAISLRAVFRKKQEIKPNEVHMNESRMAFVYDIRRCAEGMKKVTAKDRNIMIETLVQMASYDKRYHRLELYLSEIYRYCYKYPTKRSKRRQILSWIFYAIGIPISATRLSLLAYVSYDEASAMVNNAGFNIFLSILVALSLAWVYFTAVPITFVRLMNTIIDFFTKQSNPSLAQQFYPKTYGFLSLLILITAAFTFGTPTKIAYDYFNWNYALQLYFQIGISIFDFLLATCAMFDIMCALLDCYSIKYGEEHAKYIIRLQTNLENFANTVEKAPLDQYELLLFEIPAFSTYTHNLRKKKKGFQLLCCL